MSVPSDLRDAPEAIRRLGLALGAATKDQHERLVVPGARDPVLAVTIATHRRSLLLVAGLGAALHERGHSIAFDDDTAPHSLSMVLGEEAVGVSLVERLEQKDHVLTPDEERRAGKGDRYGIPKYDYFAGGRLQLVMQEVRGGRTSWSDTKMRTLEQLLGAAIVVAESEVRRRREERRVEEERRREDEQRRATPRRSRRPRTDRAPVAANGIARSTNFARARPDHGPHFRP